MTGLRELLAGIGRVLCRAEEVSLDAVEKVPLHLQRGGAPALEAVELQNWKKVDEVLVRMSKIQGSNSG